LIQREGFAGQQMQRDAVGAEGVDDDQIVAMVGRVAQGQAGVAEHDPRVVAAGLQEMKETSVARQMFDRRVDLVKTPGLAGPGIAGELAGAEPDDADPRQIAPDGYREELPEG